MTNLVTVTLTNVEVKGPFEKKDGSGSYDRHVYTAEEGEFFKFAALETEPEFEVGQTVQLLVDSQTNPRGQKTNKIVKGSVVVGEATTAPKASTGPSKGVNKTEFKVPWKTAELKSTTATSKVTTFDPRGARTGMMVNKTVDLAIHNSRGDQVTEEDLSHALQLLKAITKEAEQDN